MPLLVPWVDVWLNNPKPGTYPPQLVAALARTLRPHVPYVAVSQVYLFKHETGVSSSLSSSGLARARAEGLRPVDNSERGAFFFLWHAFSGCGFLPTPRTTKA